MSRSLEEIEINNYKFQSLDGSRSLEEIERVQSFREIDKLKSQSIREIDNLKNQSLREIDLSFRTLDLNSTP